MNNQPYNFKWFFNEGKVKITYKVPEVINEFADNAITGIAGLLGLEWYAQGVDYTTGVRDICFDTQTHKT